MPRIHLPFRGEAQPKIHGYPSPPKPIYRTIEHIFWFVFALAGVGIFCYAILNFTEMEKFDGFFVLVIYLVFLLIAIFAFRDAKQVKTITPDEDEQEQNNSQDAPTLTEDHFIEVEQPTHRKGRYPSHMNVPESRWRYRIAGIKSNSKTNQFLVGIFLGMGVLVGIAVIFRTSLPIAIGLITIICVTFLMVYLMRD